MTGYLTKDDVFSSFQEPSWQRVVFSEFEATLTSKSRPFPCVFGVSGLKAGHVRYAFPDPLTPETLGPLLKDYLDNARGFGPMTSLVVFGRPGPVTPMEDYRDRFWSLLSGLEKLDETPRPSEICPELDSASWEFCFNGEPIFVVCNSPAHVMRQSRRSTSFMITLQPRWVFDGITDSDDPAVQRSLKMVRDRLEKFDAVGTSPLLGAYGDPENREFAQYFLDDTNEAPKCPFHSMPRQDGATQTPSKGKVA